MQTKKGLIIILLPILLISILVIIKSLDKNNFSIDAKQTLDMSLNQNQILSLSQLKQKAQSNEKVVLIDLRNPAEFAKNHFKNALNIPFSEVLSNPEMLKLKSSEQELVLYSNSVAESTKAWTILTQMGFTKLYLLDIPTNLISENLLDKDTLVEGNETLKYKFQPDSTAELE